jgi:hypothetical protein
MRCDHAPCTCQVESLGEFCSESCRGAAGLESGGVCACGHPDCAGLSESLRGGIEPM